MQVTKGTWRMREQCVPGSLSSSPAQEPGNEARWSPAMERGGWVEPSNGEGGVGGAPEESPILLVLQASHSALSCQVSPPVEEVGRMLSRFLFPFLSLLFPLSSLSSLFSFLSLLFPLSSLSSLFSFLSFLFLLSSIFI